MTVAEQAARPGGKVETYRRDGFAFDVGPSLLTLPAVYRDLFLKTPIKRKGAALEDNIDLRGLERAFGYRWADGTTAMLPGSNSNRVAAALGDALGGTAEADWQKLSRRGADIWAATRVPFLESPVSGPLELLRRPGRLAAMRAVAPWQSLRALGRSYFNDPRLVTLLDRYATYTGSDPRKAPAALAVIPFVEQTFGAWHVGGGIGRLADALYERCVGRGVRFRFEAAVDHVMTEGSRVVGVRLVDGEQLKADIVVSDVDARQLYDQLLTGPQAKAPRRRLQRSTASLSGFSLLLALKGRTPGIQHHNVLFPEVYDDEFDAIFGQIPMPPNDPAIYISSPDDAGMRPDEHESWTVLVNVPGHDPERGIDWHDPTLVEAYSQRILDRLAERGYDVRERMLWHEVRTPADLADTTWSPGGAIYGTSGNSRRSAFFRPNNRSPIDGLFLVGGSVHPGGGLPLVGMSAAIVAGLIGPA